MNKKVFLLPLLILTLDFPAQAEIFKCVDASGKESFGDSGSLSLPGKKCIPLSNNLTKTGYGSRIFGKPSTGLLQAETIKAIEKHNTDTTAKPEDYYALREAQQSGWTGEVKLGGKSIGGAASSEGIEVHSVIQTKGERFWSTTAAINKPHASEASLGATTRIRENPQDIRTELNKN